MAYSKDYFDLQLKFAQKVSSLENKSLEKILLKFTSFYKTFKIEGWKFKEESPIWKNFLLEFSDSNNKIDTVYNFYLKQIRQKKEKHKKKLFGCFSYEFEPDKKCISIHFRNADSSEPGALSKERVEVRKAELKEMFKEIKERFPGAKKVCGFSWLYSLNSYRRLFPQEYVKSPKVIDDWFRSTALWGQFLDSAGNVKKEMTKNFLLKVQRAKNMNELKESFLFKVLHVEGNIKDFYKFYNFV